jgi:hypothetical protein
VREEENVSSALTALLFGCAVLAMPFCILLTGIDTARPEGGFFAGDTFVRLPFCALTTEEIDTGVRALAQVVRSL